MWLPELVAILAILFAALWTAPRWLVPRLAARTPRCLYAADVSERIVALTLDDGPDATHSPTILDVLREHEAHATFFLISSRIRGLESLVTRAVREGHELGNHLVHNAPSIGQPADAFASDVRTAGEALAHFGRVRWLRPASGWYSHAMLDTIEREGYRCALGSVYPYDAHQPSVHLSAAYVLAHARPGAVIVLHDGRTRGRRTTEVLRRVLPVLRVRGYRVVTLSELVARQR